MGIYCEYITLPHEIIVQPDSFVNSFILIFFFFFFSLPWTVYFLLFNKCGRHGSLTVSVLVSGLSGPDSCASHYVFGQVTLLSQSLSLYPGV